jgi:hydrogenase maturation protein HypF
MDARRRGVACDAHPDYASTRLAVELGLPVVPVQHHLAHVLACLLEHGGGPARVLGVAWDGTGYGGDGTVWGGEFIVVDRAARTARRVGHLRPFRLPGGEAGVRDPRRSLLGMAHSLWDGDAARLEPLARQLGFTAREANVLAAMLDRGTCSPLTTSAGRCFDAVASVLGWRRPTAFEGQAAMQVEFAADGGPAEAPSWPVPLGASRGGDRWELDWRPALAALLAAASERAPDRNLLAARFQATLVSGIVAGARAAGVGHVVLSGGCFQNLRLLRHATTRLEEAGFAVLRHRDLPPNDGGLAAGQVLGARWGITTVA